MELSKSVTKSDSRVKMSHGRSSYVKMCRYMLHVRAGLSYLIEPIIILNEQYSVGLK